MSHQVETMAFAHETPWHGLGNRVEGSVTVDEMLVAAGLDWSVNEYECFSEIKGEKIAVGKKALVRSSDQKILSIAGPNWKPFQKSGRSRILPRVYGSGRRNARDGGRAARREDRLGPCASRYRVYD